jgi:hypothetical protein
MAAIIRAKSSFLNGGLTLLRYNVSDASDGSFTVDAEFAAIRSAPVARFFRVGSRMPNELWSHPGFGELMVLMRVLDTPLLISSNVTTERGIMTIRATYGGEVETTDDDEQPNSEFSTSTELRSLSGSVRIVTNLGEESGAFSFDYYSTSSSAEIRNGGDGGAAGGLLGSPFNIRIDANIGGVGGYIGSQTVVSRQTYRNNLGQYRTSETVTPVWVQTRFDVDRRVTVSQLENAAYGTFSGGYNGSGIFGVPSNYR